MLRPILRWGADALHEPAKPVEKMTPEIDRLIDDMIETMYGAPGIGLAAPQVGVPLRLCVIDLSVGRDPAALFTLINPEFAEREGMQLEEEGCLSVPGFTATVARPRRAAVNYLDRHMQPQTLAGEDLLARAIQHELDHLDGLLFVNRLRGLQRDLIVSKIKKLSRAGKW